MALVRVVMHGSCGCVPKHARSSQYAHMYTTFPCRDCCVRDGLCTKCGALATVFYDSAIWGKYGYCLDHALETDTLIAKMKGQ